MPIICKDILLTIFTKTIMHLQCAKKVESDSLGLLDFAIRLVNPVFHLPDGQVMFFEEFK